MYVPLFADIIAAERWLMIMPMAVGTSVCAALVVAAQMQNNSFSHEQKTAAKECNMPLSTFRYRAEISKKLDYCKVGILHKSVLFDKRFLLL